jgi:hypothetical protein
VAQRLAWKPERHLTRQDALCSEVTPRFITFSTKVRSLPHPDPTFTLAFHVASFIDVSRPKFYEYFSLYEEY